MDALNKIIKRKTVESMSLPIEKKNKLQTTEEEGEEITTPGESENRSSDRESRVSSPQEEEEEEEEISTELRDGVHIEVKSSEKETVHSKDCVLGPYSSVEAKGKASVFLEYLSSVDNLTALKEVLKSWFIVLVNQRGVLKAVVENSESKR